MARFSISYELKLDDGNWVDISPIVDSRKTSIVRNICTTEFKSAVDTASFTIQPAPEFYALRSTIIDMLMNAVNDMDSHVYVKISQNDNNLFLGVIDVGDLSITTLRIPQSLTINCEDLSTLYLDTVPVNFLVYENLKVSQIVKNLIEDAGYVAGSVSLQTDDDVVIRAFVADADEKDTYRDYIDSLLFEMGGYVLDCDNDGVMNVVRIPLGETTENSSRLVDNYMSSSGIVSATAQREDDGIQLKWSTIKETDPTAPQTVYVDDIDREIDDNNHLIGEIIEPNDYWPADGAETQAYLEYEAKFLDREYQSGQKKNENKDLSLILVKNASISLTVWDENGEQIEADDAFNYPLPFDEQTNPTFYPTKAWLLLQNKMTTDANLTSVSVQGDCVYRDKINTLLMPEASANPEEYDSIYIYTLERAKHFANFYHDVKRYARTTHTWSELGNTELGSLVKIAHKTTEIGQVAYIVQVTTTFLNKDTVKSSCVAISIGAYNEYPFKEWGTNNGTPADSVYSVTDYYLASDEYQGITINTPGWSTNANYQTDDGNFLWKYTRIQYTSGKVETSAPVIIAVKGDAKTISNIVTEYAPSYDKTTPPEDGWSTTYPQRESLDQVVWQRSKLVYDDGTFEYVDYHITLGTICQYGWSPSVDIEPRARIWSWNNKLMTFGGRCVGDIRQVWHNERSKQPVPGWFLWMRWSFDNGQTWADAQCLDSATAVDFDLVGPESYQVNRLTIVEAQTLEFSIFRKNGLVGDCTWALDDASWNNGVKLSNGQQTALGDSCTINFPVTFHAPSSFTLYASVGSLEKRIIVIAEDISTKNEFVGKFPEGTFPDTAKDDKPLKDGDFILQESSTDCVPYYWDSTLNDGKGGWLMADGNTPFELACIIMSQTMYEAMKAPNTQASASIINLFTSNLAAQNAFIQMLGAQYIKLQQSGAIYSGGYDKYGNSLLGSHGFHLSGDGILQALAAILYDVKIRSLDYEGKTVLETKQAIKAEQYSFTGSTPDCFRTSDILIGEIVTINGYECLKKNAEKYAVDNAEVYGVQVAYAYNRGYENGNKVSLSMKTEHAHTFLLYLKPYPSDNPISWSITKNGASFYSGNYQYNAGDENEEVLLKSFELSANDTIAVSIDFGVYASVKCICDGYNAFDEILTTGVAPFVLFTTEEVSQEIIGWASSDYCKKGTATVIKDNQDVPILYTKEETGILDSINANFILGETYNFDSGSTVSMSEINNTVTSMLLLSGQAKFNTSDGNEIIIDDNHLAYSISVSILAEISRVVVHRIVIDDEEGSIGTAADPIPFLFADNVNLQSMRVEKTEGTTTVDYVFNGQTSQILDMYYEAGSRFVDYVRVDLEGYESSVFYAKMWVRNATGSDPNTRYFLGLYDKNYNLLKASDIGFSLSTGLGNDPYQYYNATLGTFVDNRGDTYAQGYYVTGGFTLTETKSNTKLVFTLPVNPSSEEINQMEKNQAYVDNNGFLKVKI